MQITPQASRKVRCYSCQFMIIVKLSVYGIPPANPLAPPEHFCRRCARRLHVQEFEVHHANR